MYCKNTYQNSVFLSAVKKYLFLFGFITFTYGSIANAQDYGYITQGKLIAFILSRSFVVLTSIRLVISFIISKSSVNIFLQIVSNLALVIRLIISTGSMNVHP